MNKTAYLILRGKLAAISLLNPWRAVKQLREENERLVNAIAEPLLTGINIGNGSVDIGLNGGMATQLMAGMFLGMFEKFPDAKNYIECTFSSPQGPILVTVVRPGGRTPDQLRREAERKLAEAMQMHNAEVRGGASRRPG